MGFVYILKNPSFGDEWVKIGRTSQNDIMVRVNQLNSSEATPFGFRIYATYEVEDDITIEREIHNLIDEIHYELRAREIVYGHPRTKEFFNVTPEKAYNIFKSIAIMRGDIDKLKIYPPDDGNVKEENDATNLSSGRNRAKNTTFEMIGIVPDTQLKFLYNDYYCTTVNRKNRVNYNGEEFTISALALKLGRENFGWTGSCVNGFEYFTFEDETLWNRRKRIELNNEENDNLEDN